MWGRILSTKQVGGEKREGISNSCLDRTGPQDSWPRPKITSQILHSLEENKVTARGRRKLVSLSDYMTNPNTYIKATLLITVKKQKSGLKPSETTRPETRVWENPGLPWWHGKGDLDHRGSISCLYCHTSNCKLFLLSPSRSSSAIFQQMGFLDYTLSSSPFAAAQGSGPQVAMSFFPYPHKKWAQKLSVFFFFTIPSIWVWEVA